MIKSILPYFISETPSIYNLL